jgi:hypothetical protein
MKLKIDCNQYQLSNLHWTIGDTTFSNFVATRNIGGIIPLDSLTPNPITFYWADTGTKQVTVEFDIGTTHCVKTASFVVRKPSGTIVPTVLHPVTVDQNLGQWAIHAGFGGIGDGAGIRFQQTPHDESGQYWWLQIGTIFRRVQETATMKWFRAAGVGLDGTFQYSAVSPFGTAYDGPALGLDAYAANVEVDETYVMYLMFLSSRQNSQWVPVRKVEWQWSGFATHNPNGTWSLVANTGSITNQPEGPAETHPWWEANTIDILPNFQPE